MGGNAVDYMIMGLFILFFINIIMFFVLLVRKMINKKIKEKNNVKMNFYKSYIEKIILNENDEILDLKNKNDRALFRMVLLEEISRSDKENRQKLWELSREIGFTKIEREHLNKRNKSRKATAAYRLGEFGAVESAPDLLANINKDNKELSYIIFRSLVLLTGTKHLDQIINFFDEDDFTNKARILDLISTIEVDIYPKMKEYLTGQNTFKKVVALESLTNRKDARVIPYIEKEIASHDKEIKIATLKAISGISSLQCEKILPMILDLHNDPEWEVRAFFINALKPCGDNRELVDILKKMTCDHHYQVRFNASEKLFELGEPGMVTLTELLYSSDQFVVDKAWSLINREMTLYSLMDTLKEYDNYDYIVKNIEGYKKSIESGVLNNGK